MKGANLTVLRLGKLLLSFSLPQYITVIILLLLMALQPIVAPWLLLELLDPIHSR
jgi:hypothetical protein